MGDLMGQPLVIERMATVILNQERDELQHSK
jgi:hypothetical protein